MAESQITSRAIATTQAIAKGLIQGLDWVVGVMERLLVIGITYVVLYIGWHFFKGDIEQSQKDVVKEGVKTLSESWRALLLILVVLFYRTVRTFLEKARKLAGIEIETQEKREPENGGGE